MNFTSKAESTLSEAHSLASSYGHIESMSPIPLTTTFTNHIVTPLHIAFALLSEEDQNPRLRTIFSKTAGDIVQFERSVRRQLVRLPSQVSPDRSLGYDYVLIRGIGSSSRTIVLISCRPETASSGSKYSKTSKRFIYSPRPHNRRLRRRSYP
jgi:hypothetical protein